MRILIVVLLALVALGSGAVWALAEFGGTPDVMVAETVTPVAREDVPIVAAQPASPAAREAAAAGEPVAEANAPQSLETAPAEAASPEAPPAEDAPESRSSELTSSLNERGARLALPPALDPGAAATATSPPASPAAPAPVEAAPEARASVASVDAAPVPAALADQFKTRKVAYNRPPQTLYLDRPIDISLVIDATAAANPAAELQGFPGEVVERDVDLSNTVSAQLTGVGFDIVSQTVSRQNLSERIANRWQWRVTPTEPGQRTLILEIFGYAAGSLDAEPLDAYRDEIVVEVQQMDRVITWAKGVQPVFAVLAALAGVLSAVFAFLRFREEKKRGA